MTGVIKNAARLLGLLLAVSAFSRLSAADDGRLPDTVVFKDGVELPSYAAGRELPCRAIDSGGATLTVDVSKYKGVEMIKSIDKALVAEIRVSDNTKTADLNAKITRQKITDKIKLPADSQPAAYYDAIISGDINPLLEKNPDTEFTETLLAARRALERERMLVAAGWVHRGSAWFTPAETRDFEKHQDLRSLMADLLAAQGEIRTGKYDRLVGLVERVERFKNNLHYPYLLDGAQAIVQTIPRTAMPAYLQPLMRQHSAMLIEYVEKFQKAGDRIGEIERDNLSNLDLYEPIFNDLALLAAKLPGLEGLRELVGRVAARSQRDVWIAAVRDDDGFSRHAANFQRSMKMIADSGAVSLSAAQTFQKELAAALAFQGKLHELKADNNQGEIEALKLPPSAAAIEAAQQSLSAQVADAQGQMADAARKITAVTTAYAAGDFNGAAAGVSDAVATWPDNPAAVQFKEKLVKDFEQTVAKGRRHYQRAESILLVLKNGWPNFPRIAEFTTDLHREHEFFAFFDNFSVALITVIAFGVVLAFVALKFMGQLFSD